MRDTNRDICITFSKNLKYYMDLHAVSRHDLATDLGIKYSTISNWLTCYSYASDDKIALLAEYFDISKYQLIEDNNEKSVIVSSLKKRKELLNILSHLKEDEIDILISMGKKILETK